MSVARAKDTEPSEVVRQQQTNMADSMLQRHHTFEPAIRALNLMNYSCSNIGVTRLGWLCLDHDDSTLPKSQIRELIPCINFVSEIIRRGALLPDIRWRISKLVTCHMLEFKQDFGDLGVLTVYPEKNG